MRKKHELEFIGLLLKHEDLTKKWNASNNPPIEAFPSEYHNLLNTIKEYIQLGYILSRKSYVQGCSGLPSPKERIVEETLFNSCFISGHNINDYPGLRSQINDQSLLVKLGDGIHQITKAGKSQNKQEFKKAARYMMTTLSRIVEGDLSEPFLSQYLEFPMDSIPKVLHPLIESASKSIICPKDYVAIPLLTTLAGTIGKTFELEVKEGYRESTALWTVAVGKPGSAKSPALKVATKGAYLAQSKYMAEHSEKAKQHDKDKKVYKKDLKLWERNSNGHPPVEPDKPILKRNVVSDSTVEALAPIMSDNPRGIMLLRDELAGWISSMNQYKNGKGNDVQFFLECWSGGSYSIDRKSLDQPIIIPNTYLTVCGTCQPETFKIMLGKSRQDDGFTARLLPYYPEDVGGYWTDEGIDQSLFVSINRLFELFSGFEMVEDEWGNQEPNVLLFSKCGKKEFRNAMERHHELKNEYCLTGMVESAWAKQRGHIARLALIIHLIRFHSDETTSINVDKQSVLMAERLSMYFLAHIEKIWCRGNIQNVQQEQPLYDKLNKWDKEITPRNLISSRFAKTKKDAIIKLDQIEQKGKGRWTTPDKKVFQLVV
ncbi:MAG: DUF3987 domain-containing protein [Bacteroidales bacterium]|nr:DUF3987 domain-containing protein [Bacteroidales bacterium]